MNFAAYHDFAVKTCRVYRPRTKGKVERPVDYLKDNFLAGRTFADVDDLNAQVQHWLDHTVNVRVHGTTGAVPKERLAEETLTPVSAVAPYRFAQPVTRVVSREAMVCFQGSRYSAPPMLAGQSVRVSADGGHVSTQACKRRLPHFPLHRRTSTIGVNWFASFGNPATLFRASFDHSCYDRSPSRRLTRAHRGDLPQERRLLWQQTTVFVRG
jgi:hypothetical protein